MRCTLLGAGVKYLFVAEHKFYAAYFHAPLQHNRAQVAPLPGGLELALALALELRRIKPSAAIQVEKFKPTFPIPSPCSPPLVRATQTIQARKCAH